MRGSRHWPICIKRSRACIDAGISPVADMRLRAASPPGPASANSDAAATLRRRYGPAFVFRHAGQHGDVAGPRFGARRPDGVVRHGPGKMAREFQILGDQPGDFIIASGVARTPIPGNGSEDAAAKCQGGRTEHHHAAVSRCHDAASRLRAQAPLTMRRTSTARPRPPAPGLFPDRQCLIQRRAAGKRHSGGPWCNACRGRPRPQRGHGHGRRPAPLNPMANEFSRDFVNQ